MGREARYARILSSLLARRGTGRLGWVVMSFFLAFSAFRVDTRFVAVLVAEGCCSVYYYVGSYLSGALSTMCIL